MARSTGRELEKRVMNAKMKTLTIVACSLTLGMPLFGGTTGASGVALNELVHRMGGSVVQPLIEICNNEDCVVTASSLARQQATIGPMRYYKPEKLKAKTGFAYGGEFRGRTMSGEEVSGSVYNKTAVIYAKKMSGWKIDVPDGFYDCVSKIESMARHKKEAEACAEIGAVIFCGGMKGKMGYGERKMVDYFKRAADGDSVNGKFMYAYCLFNGIGIKADTAKAVAVMQELPKNHPASGRWISKCLSIKGEGR